MVYRHEIDGDAYSFAETLVTRNPGYARAYVMDICRTEAGLKLLETNYLNAADLEKLVMAIEALGTRWQ